MSQAYSDPKRASEPHALPAVEVWYVGAGDAAEGFGNGLDGGWYWHTCLPGCLPDSEPCGPFASEALALADAQADGSWTPVATLRTVRNRLALIFRCERDGRQYIRTRHYGRYIPRALSSSGLVPMPVQEHTKRIFVRSYFGPKHRSAYSFPAIGAVPLGWRRLPAGAPHA